MSEDTCCSSGKSCMILACSGGSNVGQLSNQVAIELTREGLGSFSCLAGIGAGLSGFTQSAKDADEVVVIDGCPIGCAKAIFASQGLAMRNYLVVTDLGIQKVKKFDLEPGDIEKVKNAVQAMLSGGRQPENGCVARD
jgi:uncharacterized metal-binding protein